MLVLRRFTLTGRLFGAGAAVAAGATFVSGSCVPLFSVTAVVDETVPVDDEEMAILVVVVDSADIDLVIALTLDVSTVAGSCCC